VLGVLIHFVQISGVALAKFSRFSFLAFNKLELIIWQACEQSFSIRLPKRSAHDGSARASAERILALEITRWIFTRSLYTLEKNSPRN